MAESVEPVGVQRVVAHAEVARAVAAELPRAQVARGERVIARVLRLGATASGGLFLLSLALELLPATPRVELAIELLRTAAASTLLGTPVVRLVASGAVLGARGEWRYVGYALAILSLLGIAVGARFAV